MLYYTILYYELLCYDMLCSALHCTALHWTLLYSTYAMLCCAMLYYTMHMHWRETWGECPRILKQLSYNLHRENYTACSKRSCSQIVPDATRCSKMLPDDPICFQMLPDAPRDPHGNLNMEFHVKTRSMLGSMLRSSAVLNMELNMEHMFHDKDIVKTYWPRVNMEFPC